MSQPNAIHIVELIEDAEHLRRTQTRRHFYRLQEAALREVLMRDSVKDLPVAVVSVAGALRMGKSFLLNYFIRYLSASEASRADGSWLGRPGQVLTGFDWAPGSDRSTTGILLWPEPFIIQKDGQQVAVFLMDTQGTFDSNSSYRDNCTVFGFSSLVSSLQIYNLRGQITECDLMNLEAFTQYGIFLREQVGEAFQELKFLVRDWERSWEYPLRADGGEGYKQRTLQVTDQQSEPAARIRQRITSSFEEISCFLMPHPGEEVPTPDFQNNPGELRAVFRQSLLDLVACIFSPENLRVKMLAGEPLTAQALFHLIRSYVDEFNSDEMPEPGSIFELQSETSLLMAANAARILFGTRAAAETALSMPDDVLVDVHARLVDEALAAFSNRRLFGDQADIDRVNQEIRTELTDRLHVLRDTNTARSAAAVAAGAAAYNEVMSALRQNRQLCVHARDLELAHAEGLVAARRVFLSRRRLVEEREDLDSLALLESCQAIFDTKQGENDFINMANVNEMKNEYNSYMSAVCNRNPKLNEADFAAEHTTALNTALANFEAKRCRNSSYPQDAYKDRLAQDINTQFESWKETNRNLRAGMIQMALAKYNQESVSVGELRRKCLHPEALKNLHNAAIEQALGVLRPDRPRGGSFNINDRDELLMLKNPIEAHYETLLDINKSANDIAVAAAFKVYKDVFHQKTNYVGYWTTSWEQTKKYHDEAFKEASNEFYDLRRDRDYHGEDPYLKKLEEKCKAHYNPKNKTEHGAKTFFRGMGSAMEQINDDYVLQDDGTLRDNW